MAYTFARSSSQYMVVPTPTVLNGLAAITVMAWARLQSLDFAQGPIASRQLGTGTDSVFLLNMDIPLDAYTALVSTDAVTGAIAVSGSTVVANEWVHLAMTWGSGVGLRLYVNGVLDGSNAAAGTVLATTTRQFLIGGVNTVAGLTPFNFFDGQIEDMRIYSSVLSAAAIATIHACKGKDGIVNGLLARYPFYPVVQDRIVSAPPIAELAQASSTMQVTSIPNSVTGSGFNIISDRRRNIRL